MSTPVSNADPYCTAAQFLIYADWRTIADLCSDLDGRPLQADLVDASTTVGTILVEFLAKASGDLESACFTGGKYTPEDIAGMTGNQAATIRGIVANKALWYFFMRRPDIGIQVPQACQQADAFLNAIATGERVFGIQEAIDASHLEIEVETAQDVENRNLITRQADRLFGRRANRRVR